MESGKNIGRVTNAHHLAPGGLGDLHLLQHLVPLLHDERPLVGVGGHVRVVHLDHVNLSLNSGNKKIRSYRNIFIVQKSSDHTPP